jgi:hypothetical protein
MRSAALAGFLGFIASPGEARQHSTFRVHAEANAEKNWPKRK